MLPGMFLLSIAVTSCGMDPSEPGNLVPKTVMEDPSLPAETHNGVRLHLEVRGSDSDTVYFVHGGPGFDYRSLISLADAISGKTVVLYDQRGSGLSERVAESALSLDAHVADLKSIVNTHGGTNIMLIGHSWGGVLVQAFIKQYPAAAAKIVFLASMPPNDTEMNKVAENYPSLFGNEFAGYLAQRNGIGEGSHAELDFRYINFQPIQKFYFCNDNDFRNVPFWRFGYVALFKTLESLLDGPISGASMTYKYDFRSSNAAFTGSVRVLYGECDNALGENASRPLAESFSSASSSALHKISNGGHYFWITNPTDAAVLINGF